MNIVSSFCWCFYIRKSLALCKLLRLLLRNLPPSKITHNQTHLLLFQIRFIANNDKTHGLISIYLGIVNPSLNSFKRISSWDIEYDQGSCCWFVIRCCDWFEMFLPSGVSDLQFYSLVFNLDYLGSEFYTDCDLVRLSEAFVGELE